MALVILLSGGAQAGLPRAGTCGGCHVENFRDWRSSAHSRAVSGERFRKALKEYLLRHDTDEGGFCFRCHAPGVLITGGVFEATEDIVRGRPHVEGVGCAVCHSVETVKDGVAVYDPGESRGYHGVKDLRSIDKEGLCNTCHSSYRAVEREEAAEKKGLLAGVFSWLGRMVGVGASNKIDHTFSGTIVPEDESCPGMKRD